MFDEARFAFLKGRDERLNFDADQWLRVLANNQRRASQEFGIDLLGLAPGSAADLIVLGYSCPTPLIPGNLPWHFVFGMSSAQVESVMVAGRFIVRDRQPAVDASTVAEQARKASEKLWAKIQEL
jgi:cytosine/adenosine deaminase-related metal-dependent hydrolase